ncbi:NifU family protein [Candidatus Bathyarchaeota archaeon]|nr:NifU family protein [Candidatus Bathyarchaeota archaeon]
MATKLEVEKILDEVRPQLQADGGNIELIDVIDGVVRVKLKGSCAGCPMAAMTLKNGVERYLKSKISGIQRVEEA